MYQVLLYYCYTPLEKPEEFREEHHRFCLELDLRGRIIVAAEGLNGTVSGTAENCARYMAAVKADPRKNQPLGPVPWWWPALKSATKPVLGLAR